MRGVSWGLPGAACLQAVHGGCHHELGEKLFAPGKKTRQGWGRRGEQGRVLFPFNVTQAESQSAHVNELENAIKNIYILETVIQNLM